MTDHENIALKSSGPCTVFLPSTQLRLYRSTSVWSDTQPITVKDGTRILAELKTEARGDFRVVRHWWFWRRWKRIV